MARKKMQYGAGSLIRKTRVVDGQRVEMPNWYIQYCVNGKVHRESTGTSVYNEAQAKLKTRWAEIENSTLQTTKARKNTMEDLITDLAEYYRVKRPRSFRTFASPIIKCHLMPYFKDMRANSISTTQLTAYVAERDEAGAAVASVNRELALLRRAFKLAVAHTPPKLLPQHVPSFDTHMRDEDNARQGFWEHDQYVTFKGALPRDEADLLTYAYFTGCRLGEILKLTWEYVDLEHAAIRLPRLNRRTGLHMKGKKPRIIPLQGPGNPLYDMLANRWALRAELCPTTEWVFFRSENRGNRGKSTRQIGTRMTNITHCWEKAAEATGINLLRHDLRRTGVRNLIRAGVPQRVAMAISGHKTTSVFDRYNIVDERDLQDAAGKLAAYVSKK